MVVVILVPTRGGLKRSLGQTKELDWLDRWVKPYNRLISLGFCGFTILCFLFKFLFKLGFSKRNSNCSLQFIHVSFECVDLWIIAVELKHPQVAFALALPGALTNHLLIDPQMLQRACPASPLGGGRFGCCGGAAFVTKSDVICDQGRVQLVLCALGSFKFCWPILHLGCIRVGKGLDKDS